MVRRDLSLVTLAHGAGGTVMQDLVKKYIVKHLGGSKAEVPLEALDDAAVINGVVLKSDSYTVKPLFFPGGDIGRLSISGTINDISVMGAEPIALASGFIIEEGFPFSDLENILKGMGDTCREAGVPIITGDTKVMEKGALDKFVVNISGVGLRSEALEKNIAEVKRYRPFEAHWLIDSNIKRGDKIILSGTIGDHGMAVLSAREGYGFKSNIVSDVTPLNRMIRRVLEVGGVVKIKDPTRGGLANLLNEWSGKSGVGILVDENKIPVEDGVRAACEMLGIDVLEVGNEGKVAIAVVPQKAEEVLAVVRETKEGRDAQVIGEATDEFDAAVLNTVIGGKRVISAPVGDPIPRIC